MWFSSWLRNQRRSDSTRCVSTPAPVRNRATFRPQLEALEDRLVPSTLTVTSAADSGAGSLRADIAAAQPGDTIAFAPSLAGQTITLTTGNLVINKSLTIQGPGASQLAISGGNKWGVFEVYGPTTNATLSGLTITHGNGRGNPEAAGGGILNFDGSTLTVSGCIVSNNADLSGGGIANSLATLNIVNSTLTGNVANDSNGPGDGGAVYSIGGKVSMTNSTLSKNRANEEGGGIYIRGGTMTINGCTLSGNIESNYAGGGYSPAWGNEIYNANTSPATLTVTDSVFANNTPYRYFSILGPWVNGGGNTFN